MFPVYSSHGHGDPKAAIALIITINFFIFLIYLIRTYIWKFKTKNIPFKEYMFNDYYSDLSMILKIAFFVTNGVTLILTISVFVYKLIKIL